MTVRAECPECLCIKVADTYADLAGQGCECRHAEVVWDHEFVCLLCGRFVCVVTTRTELQPFRWPTRHCDVCGGSAVPNGEWSRREAKPAEQRMWFPTPRRGRPRKDASALDALDDYWERAAS